MQMGMAASEVLQAADCPGMFAAREACKPRGCRGRGAKAAAVWTKVLRWRTDTSLATSAMANDIDARRDNGDTSQHWKRLTAKVAAKRRATSLIDADPGCAVRNLDKTQKTIKIRAEQNSTRKKYGVSVCGRKPRGPKQSE